MWEPAGTYETLGYERLHGAARIELRRPEVLNAWDHRLPAELLDAVRAAAADDGVRALMLTGAGRAFSSGADVRSSLMTGGPEPIMRSLREETNRIVLELRAMPKPVIAAVNGVAAGVGCSLALASDIVVAAESASFLLSFTRIGLTPDGGSSLFASARLGHARAFRLALLAERIGAAEALAWGMIERVVPDARHRELAEALALELAAGPTAAYAATKRSLNNALYPRLAEQLELESEGQERLLSGADYAEGVAAFLERRAPVFTGR